MTAGSRQVDRGARREAVGATRFYPSLRASKGDRARGSASLLPPGHASTATESHSGSITLTPATESRPERPVSKPKSPSLTLAEFAAHGVLVSPRWYADPALAHDLRGHWRINREGYVERSEHGGGKTLLHRLVRGARLRDGRIVDHKNRNRLDCRDENLIFVTPAASARNRDRPTPGLTFDPQRNRWELRTPTAKFGRRVRLGRFKTRPEAVARWECFSRHGALCECWKLAQQPAPSRPEAQGGASRQEHRHAAADDLPQAPAGGC